MVEALVTALILGSLLLPWHRVMRALGKRRDDLVCRRHGTPPIRPLEQLAKDARRLGAQHRHRPRGKSFAKCEAHRRAYDNVLGEACAALDITHLLAVLVDSAELDAERARVEWELECRGLELGLPLV